MVDWLKEIGAELLLLLGILAVIDPDVPGVVRGFAAAVAITSLRRIVRQEARRG